MPNLMIASLIEAKENRKQDKKNKEISSCNSLNKKDKNGKLLKNKEFS